MKRVYEASHTVEAHMIAHLLQQAGLQAEVTGEHLQSGAGELPLGTLVAVVVPDEQVEEARQVIGEWESRTTTSSEARPVTATRGSHFMAFVMGGLLSGALVWAYYSGPSQQDEFDRDDDGTIDERFIYRGRGLHRIETDRNFDGRVDAVARYRREGDPHSLESDDDFDGVFESKTLYEHGQVALYTIDRNRDGRADYRLRYVNGAPNVAEYLDPDSATLVKKVYFSGAVQERAELDLDRDGTWDRSYRFDQFDEPISP